MKDQPMPEAIQGLIRATTLSPVSNEKADCHTTESNEKNNFVKDFGPQPTATSYDNGIKPAKDKSFSKDFHPDTQLFLYNDGVVKGDNPLLRILSRGLMCPFTTTTLLLKEKNLFRGTSNQDLTCQFMMMVSGLKEKNRFRMNLNQDQVLQLIATN